MNTKKSKGPTIDPGICRCCGSLKKCRLLNHEYETTTKKEIYSEMMMECFGLVLSHLDGKPTDRLVCATCVQRLRDAYSFREQVIKCEDTFIQAKIYTTQEKDCENKVEWDVAANAPTTKIKIELTELMEVDNDEASPLDDDGPLEDIDNNIRQGDIKKSPRTPDSDNLPLKILAKPTVITKSITEIKQNIKTLDHGKMLSLQLRMRERDPTYKTESNVLTLVENSYICPFKCRHNYLLCYYCGQHFTDPQPLREHTAQLHNPKKFKLMEHKNMLKIDLTRIDCRLCNEKIDNLDQFKHHISNVHSKKYYMNHRDLVLPFKFTKDEIKCALCESTFPYFHALNKHMNVHFSNYVCELCGLGFVDKGRFVMHQQKHEASDYPCTTCGKVFKAAYNRDLHVDRIHNKKGRVYCPKCDVKLMTYPQKLKHLVEVHGEKPLSFPCTACDRVFDTRRTLTLHKRKVHLKDYRFECQTCGQRFFTRFSLNNHMPTHTGERNFTCKVCGKSYPRLKTLKYHIRIHTNDRRYRCHICGQAFIQNCSLKGHMKSQHPEYS